MTTQLLLSGSPDELQSILDMLIGKNGKPEPGKMVEIKSTKKKVKEPEPEEEDDLTGETSTEVTIEEIRGKVKEKSTVGKREEIKKLLKSFGAASVTELDEENYGEFMLKLEKL